MKQPHGGIVHTPCTCSLRSFQGACVSTTGAVCDRWLLLPVGAVPACCVSDPPISSPGLAAVAAINAAIQKGVAEKTVLELMNPEAQLPQVYPFAADLYQKELATLQRQSPEVGPRGRSCLGAECSGLPGAAGQNLPSQPGTWAPRGAVTPPASPGIPERLPSPPPSLSSIASPTPSSRSPWRCCRRWPSSTGPWSPET